MNTLDMGLAPAPPSSKDVLDAVLLPLCRKYGLPYSCGWGRRDK